MAKKQQKQSYGNESITTLKGADRVRKRPAVIFGSDGIEGCQHSAFEILSNSIDEAREGYGSEIYTTLFRDGSVEIEDFGRGIPVDYNKNEERYNWELVFCELYAGGKYNNSEAENYEFSLGLNGLGLCSTQYSSEYMDVSIRRDGTLFTLHFEHGENVGGLGREPYSGKKTGTKIRWKPDIEVFTDIKLTDDMRRRLRAIMPEEALPAGNTLRLSDDKAFCMEEMRKSMQNNMAETAWPKTQYLWPLHPLFTWINDKAGLLFERGQAPLVGLAGKLEDNEIIYVVSGSIPNLKSTPLVDEWFGIQYKGDSFVKTMDMEEVLQRTGIRSTSLSNTDEIKEDQVIKAEALLEDVVAKAKDYLKEKYKAYQDRIDPLLDKEVDKLINLQKKHHEYYRVKLSEYERKREEKERSVDKLFEEFIEWVKETLTIQDNPYIRIVAVFTEVSL